jgi:hypothetical protein
MRGTHSLLPPSCKRQNSKAPNAADTSVLSRATTRNEAMRRTLSRIKRYTDLFLLWNRSFRIWQLIFVLRSRVLRLLQSSFVRPGGSQHISPSPLHHQPLAERQLLAYAYPLYAYSRIGKRILIPSHQCTRRCSKCEEELYPLPSILRYFFVVCFCLCQHSKHHNNTFTKTPRNIQLIPPPAPPKTTK